MWVLIFSLALACCMHIDKAESKRKRIDRVGLWTVSNGTCLRRGLCRVIKLHFASSSISPLLIFANYCWTKSLIGGVSFAGSLKYVDQLMVQMKS